MSLNLLLVTIGTAGDICPYVGLGKALKARGHRVTLIANGFFRRHAEEAGLAFVPSGTAEEYHAIQNRQDVMRRSLRRLHGLRASYCGPVRNQYAAIARIYEPRTTMILAPCSAWAARLANEKLGVPWMAVVLQPHDLPKAAQLPYLPPSISRCSRQILWRLATLAGHSLLGSDLRSIRAELDLPPLHSLKADWWLSPSCVLGLFPDWFAAPVKDWEIHTVLSHFVMYDGSCDDALPEDAIPFFESKQRPIVISGGTGMRNGRAFFEVAIHACVKLGKPAVVVTPHVSQLPAELPDSCAHFEYLPFGKVLPKAAAIIHHGGVGTTAHGMQAGIPQLLMPAVYDQPDNARRIRRLGVGDYVERHRFKEPEVSTHLARLLSSSSTAARCSEVAQRFDPVRTLDRTCAIVEDAARTAHATFKENCNNA